MMSEKKPNWLRRVWTWLEGDGTPFLTYHEVEAIRNRKVEELQADLDTVQKQHEALRNAVLAHAVLRAAYDHNPSETLESNILSSEKVMFKIVDAVPEALLAGVLSIASEEASWLRKKIGVENVAAS